MHHIAEPAQLLFRVIAGTAVDAFGIDGDAGVAMAQIDKRHRVIVFTQHIVVVSGVIGRILVVHVRIAIGHIQLALQRHAPFIQAAQLFVQMIEGSARLLEPVLIHGDVTDIAVVGLNVGHGGEGETEIIEILIRSQFAGGT